MKINIYGDGHLAYSQYLKCLEDITKEYNTKVIAQSPFRIAAEFEDGSFIQIIPIDEVYNWHERKCDIAYIQEQEVTLHMFRNVIESNAEEVRYF